MASPLQDALLRTLTPFSHEGVSGVTSSGAGAQTPQTPPMVAGRPRPFRQQLSSQVLCLATRERGPPPHRLVLACLSSTLAAPATQP